MIESFPSVFLLLMSVVEKHYRLLMSAIVYTLFTFLEIGAKNIRPHITHSTTIIIKSIKILPVTYYHAPIVHNETRVNTNSALPQKQTPNGGFPLNGSILRPSIVHLKTCFPIVVPRPL